MIILIIFIMNIVIKNSNNNILLKKKEKKTRDCPKDTLFQTGFEPATFEFPTYLPNYLTCPNDLGYPTICVFRCFINASSRRFDHKLFSTLYVLVCNC